MASRNWKQHCECHFGGVSVGLGIGVIILAGGTTAGTTILGELQRNTSM